VRDPDARHYLIRLPKKLRKRKWKIGAIKNFVHAHIFGYGETITEEVTSSRAAEKFSTKPPSTKGHRKDQDDVEEENDEKAVDDARNSKHRRKIMPKPKEKGMDKKERFDKRTNERTREQFVEEAAREPSLFVKLIWGLEQFSLCASDLNVVVFFFSLPWLRQLWR